MNIVHNFVLYEEDNKWLELSNDRAILSQSKSTGQITNLDWAKTQWVANIKARPGLGPGQDWSHFCFFYCYIFLLINKI